jgi:hypothetical protein
MAPWLEVENEHIELSPVFSCVSYLRDINSWNVCGGVMGPQVPVFLLHVLLNRNGHWTCEAFMQMRHRFVAVSSQNLSRLLSHSTSRDLSPTGLLT